MFTLLLFAAVFSASWIQLAAAQCPALKPDGADYELTKEAKALHAAKIKQALATINDDSAENHCTEAAIGFVGQFKVQEAIPRLIAMLSFEHTENYPIRNLSLAARFPAVGALGNMGRPAIAPLLNAIKTAQDDVIRKNATFAFMMNHRNDPGSGVAELQELAANEPDHAAADNLYLAAAYANDVWCNTIPGWCDTKH